MRLGLHRPSLVFAAFSAMVLVVAILVNRASETPPASGPADTPREPTAEIRVMESTAARLVAANTQHWLVASALNDPEGLPEDPDQGERSSYGTLKGRLMWKEGRLPLTGVEIAMTRSWLDTVLPTVVEDEPQDPVLLERRVTTDEHGVFSIYPVPTDGNLFFLIGRDEPFMDFRKVPKLPLPGHTVDLGEIYIEERGSLTGRVVRPGGLNVNNVQVRAVDDPFLKDPLASEELRRDRNLESIDPDGMVRGEVVPDWLSRRDRLLPFPQTETRGDGTFLIRGLRPGQHVVYFRQLATAASRRVLIASGQTTDLGDVRVGVGETLSGRLEYRSRDFRSREPVVGAELAAVSSTMGIGPPVVHSNARGEFRFFGLVSGEPVHIIYRIRPGEPWLLLTTETPGANDRPRLETYRIERATVARIHLVDQEGVPIPRATVRLMRTTNVFRREDVRLPDHVQPVEEEPGSWTARIANPVGLRLIASAEGHAPAVTPVKPEAFRPEGMTLMMLRAFPMRFSVTDYGGEPVEGAEVHAAIREAEWYPFAGSSWSLLSAEPVNLGLTDSDGILERDGFWGTNMVFAAVHPEYANSPIQNTVPEKDRVVDLRLVSPGRIEGHVSEGYQQPVRRWRIQAEPNRSDNDPLFHNPFLRTVTTITSADGSFSIPHLHPGRWTLRPLLPAAPGAQRLSFQEEWLQRMTRSIYVQEEQTVYTDMELEHPPWREASITGAVELDGVSEPGLVVRLYRTESRPSSGRELRRWEYRRRLTGPQLPVMLHSSLTDHAGEFRFFDVPSGRYVVALEIPHQGRAQRLGAVTVHLDEEQPQKLELKVLTGTLQCTIITEEGRTLAGRMFRLQMPTDDGTGAEFVVLSDSIGMIRLPRMPMGDYVLSLDGDPPWEVIEPGFRIRDGEFTMRSFVTRRPGR